MGSRAATKTGPACLLMLLLSHALMYALSFAFHICSCSENVILYVFDSLWKVMVRVKPLLTQSYDFYALMTFFCVLFDIFARGHLQVDSCFFRMTSVCFSFSDAGRCGLTCVGQSHLGLQRSCPLDPL